MWCAELTVAIAGAAKRLHPVAVSVVLRDARVDIAVADEDVALWIPRHVGRLAELAINRRQGRTHAFPWLRFVRGLLFPPEDHRHVAGRIEANNHIRALVDRPDVVVLVHSDVVRVREAVQILPDLTDELSCLVELEQLRGRSTKRRPGRVPAVEHEHMTL